MVRNIWNICLKANIKLYHRHNTNNRTSVGYWTDNFKEDLEKLMDDKKKKRSWNIQDTADAW